MYVADFQHVLLRNENDSTANLVEKLKKNLAVFHPTAADMPHLSRPYLDWISEFWSPNLEKHRSV